MRTTGLDRLNFALVIAACLIAHAVPLDMLVLSYAILGPAHYLTEISWLHDRQYFAKRKYDYLPLCAIALGALALGDRESFYLGLILTFSLAIAMAFLTTWAARLAVALPVSALCLVLMVETPAIWFFILLTSLVHILLFTAFFVLLGALRNDSLFGYATLAAMALCGATFFIPGQPWLPPSWIGLQGVPFLQPTYTAFFELIGVTEGDPNIDRLLGFLSFAYTYHYLNWFSKTGLIGWHRISTTRAGVLGALYLACIGLYAYDFALGFKVVLFLSLAHVVLEFPLNGLSVAEIGKRLGGRLKPG